MMRKLKNILATGAVLSLLACGSGTQEFDGAVSIKGQLKNQPEGYVVLSRYEEDRSEVVDTIPVSDKGEFEYQVSLDGPGFYELDLYGQKVARLALYNEDVKVEYDFDNEDSFKATGSHDTDQILKVDALVEQYQEEINQLNSEYYEAMSARDQQAIKAIQDKSLEIAANHSNRVKETIRSMDGSFASLAAVMMIDPNTEFEFLDSLISGLDQKYPNTKTIVSLRQQLDEMRSLSVGQLAPEIALPNPEGELVKLSDLRGKFVLIDFWAAWCKPCREENPNVVRLYHQYKDKGFEVFGVSLDRTKEAWVGAIEEDGLEWTQVSDLKYFNSEAAATYQINAIPATYMLDPDGKIIAKDLRGASLEGKLRELFPD
ncbi:MAG TPA: TlpA disulfide reductase family protein [Cyclobacteriaceae bacterium]|nr:TlpA disulfide reductase family protein [Cyclobacteriaceae bacterium]